jgi:hypothetical protein
MLGCRAQWLYALLRAAPLIVEERLPSCPNAPAVGGAEPRSRPPISRRRAQLLPVAPGHEDPLGGRVRRRRRACNTRRLWVLEGKPSGCPMHSCGSSKRGDAIGCCAALAYFHSHTKIVYDSWRQGDVLLALCDLLRRRGRANVRHGGQNQQEVISLTTLSSFEPRKTAQGRKLHVPGGPVGKLFGAHGVRGPTRIRDPDCEQRKRFRPPSSQPCLQDHAHSHTILLAGIPLPLSVVVASRRIAREAAPKRERRIFRHDRPRPQQVANSADPRCHHYDHAVAESEKERRGGARAAGEGVGAESAASGS